MAQLTLPSPIMFTDDTKVYNLINSPDDQQTLPDDLDYLTYWSSQWLLRFHTDKQVQVDALRENSTAGVCL